MQNYIDRALESFQPVFSRTILQRFISVCITWYPMRFFQPVACFTHAIIIQLRIRNRGLKS